MKIEGSITQGAELMSGLATAVNPFRVRRAAEYMVVAIFAAVSTVSVSAEGGRGWSPMDDLSYYRSIQADTANARWNIFHASLAAALQSRRYRERVNSVAGRNCDAWIALQSVQVNWSTYDVALFCRKGAAWTVLHGGEGGEESAPGLLSSEEMEGLLSRSKVLADGPRLGIGFDALTSYVTTYDGQSVGRFAVYGVEDGRSGNVLDFRSADDVVRDLEHVIQCARNPVRQD